MGRFSCFFFSWEGLMQIKHGLTAFLVLVLLALAGCGDGATIGAGGEPSNSQPLSRPESESSPWLGTNLAGIADYGSDWPFVDMFKQSRAWTPVTPTGGGIDDESDPRRQIDLDEMGWVRSLQKDQAARAYLFFGGPKNYPKGAYLLLWEGEGKLTAQYAGMRSLGKGCAELRPPDPGKGFSLTIEQTNPANYLRNIKLIRPGHWGSLEDNTASDSAIRLNDAGLWYDGRTFVPEWIEHHRKYGLLRFMDWGRTNESLQKHWADMPPRDYAQYTSRRGVPLAIMLEASNATGNDAWLCIPYQATDEYVRQYAEFVLHNLDPERRVFFEYGNEAWNGPMFQHYHYNVARAKELGIDYQWDRPGQQSDGYGAWKVQSLRSAEIFTIIEQVFGSAAMGERVIRVLGTQPWPDQLRQMLDYQDGYKKFDAVAVAAYFGHHCEPHLTSLDDLFAWLPSAMDETCANLMKIRGIAAQRGIERFLAYEGGQHLWANHPTDQQAKVQMAAQQDPRMEDLYAQLFRRWREEMVGAEFCHYTNISPISKEMSWGALEYLSQPPDKAPKWRAIEHELQEAAAGSGAPAERYGF